MSDRIKIKFILNTSAEFFSQNPSSQLSDDGSIQEFFHNDEINTLAATFTENVLTFHHTVPTEENCILFYKIPQLGVEQSSTIDVPIGILTLEGGLVKSIYNSVSRVYAPHVTKQKVDYSPEIEKIIENLHTTLGASLGLSQSGIHTVQDEMNFWNQKLINSPTRSDKDKAKAIIDILENLNLQIRTIQKNSLKSIDEFLDSIHNTLDELWRLPYAYPQNRMIDLMNIISSIVIDTCVDSLSTVDVWNINSIQTSQVLSENGDIIESWIHMCDTLTRLFWPNNGANPWSGNPHIPKSAQFFRERLNEIKTIKNMYTQIATIFNEDDQMDKILMAMFHPFIDINIFDISAFGTKRWKKALSQFEVMLQPIDEKMASLLKAKLNNHLKNPRQIIHIFSQYDSILRRPTIMSLLTAERELFFQSINDFIKEIKASLHQKTSYQSNVNLSPICWECRWLRVVLHQVNEVIKVSHLIDERHGYEEMKKMLTDTKEDTENLLKNNFELWREESAADIKNGELSLRDDKPVVEFERDGRQLMQVTFKPKLLTFCHDVREFESLGFRIPIELRDTATHATKFMACARRLQQIATFHNTIGDRMIPCQRPILLKNAMELSKLVRSESVAWNDEDSANRYVAVLQNAVSNLSRDNTYLAGQHEETKRIIIKLMNIDLLRQGEIWKDEMRHLRDIIATLETKGYTNLQAFKLHWDHQLYKVLEQQYLEGLTDLNTRLPDIHIEIIFRQQKLQFRPPIEEIKSKYYSQLRKFLERPLRFRGLSDQSTRIFKVMVERNRHRFVGLYQKSGNLFQQLNSVLDVWMPWIALGQINLDDLCEIHLTAWNDWDRNFKACKHFSQQIAKIQNSEDRLDCFVINLLPLRSDIEFISRKYWETLSNTLRASILKDISVLQDFLQNSLQVLQNVVLDESGIAEAGAKYERIMTDLPKMTDLLKTVEGKDTCLAGWCKERVSALSSILLQWDQLQPLIENHSAVLQRQIDIMRDYIESQMSNLKEEAEKFHIRWESTIKDLEINETVNLQVFKDRQEAWKGMKEKRDLLEADSIKYNISFPTELGEIFDKIDNDVTTNGEQWELFENFEKDFESVANEELSIYRRRPYILTDFLLKWSNLASAKKTTASSRIQLSLDAYQSALPIIQNLQSDGLTEKHWSRILNLTEQTPKPYHDICLKDLFKNVPALLKNETAIVNMVRQASSEQIIRAALTELDQWGATATFKTTSHTDTKNGPLTLIRDFQEVLNKIGDHQCLLQSAMNSAASDEFSDQAHIWENRLTLLDRNLTSLNQIQRKWIYLEPIFGVGTLKTEMAAFQRIDKDFRYIMREISNDSRILSITKISNLSTIIESLENQLSKCQSTLTSFILTKRNSFPRFYFLADDDLLEMLGQSTKLEVIQKHIKKIIPGIHEIGVSTMNQTSAIEKIFSVEGDEVVLKNKIEISGLVEEWLNKLVLEIRLTLIDLIKNCSQMDLLSKEQIQAFPIQVLCIAKALSFTKLTEKSITSMTLQSHLKSIKTQIDLYSALLIETTDGLISSKIRSILIDLVHHVSIVEHLIENNVTNLQDWSWLQQIKYYMSPNQIVTIKMVYAEFEYSYEYLGNPNKLVNTKLTHNCYLTLMQAMHLGLGGNPFGPAGTGKTECVKALGAMLGRLVLVFNCNENIDTHAIGLILSGLAQCGAWGCFDEFNRLKEETLSAISMIIQPLQTAIKEKDKSVTILDESIPLNHHCGMFVTLNPAGQDYGGRQNLPHNLQALFRPIVMQQPEPADIAKVMLFVEGFKTGDKIGNRMVELFRLAGNILSPQRHYEWGLRELKTVLYACGKSLRDKKQVFTDEDEMELAVEALRSNTMSKLNEADCNLFDMLISEVFPGTNKKISSEDQLKKFIEEAFSSMDLMSNEKQIEKCVQLYEQLEKRMGVVVLGPPRSGKTTIISVLKQALSSMGKTIRTYTIAPKSMNRTQLLGRLDPDTRQWHDGVLTNTAIAVNAEKSVTVAHMLICDGDVDPEWIEALNSVLDDNRLLTLPSGWRIQFGNNVNFIFETHDLSNASPATISRMGIVNLSEADLNPSIIIETWLKKQVNAEGMEYLMDEFHRSFEYIEKLKRKPVISSKVGLISSGLEFLNDCVNKEQFCVGLARGLGSSLNPLDLNAFCLNTFESADIYVPNKNEAELCFYNTFQNKIEYYSTDHTTENEQVNKTNSVLIKTGHIKMFSDVVRQFMKNSKNLPFLIVGPSGCGKSLLVQTLSSEFSGTQLITINCSAQLTADSVLHALQQNCLVVSGIRGREYKPKFTKLILYLKNINLCYTDNYGTSEVVELLLQLIYRKGFYATDTLEWISINDLQIGCSLANDTKMNLSPRFMAIVQLLVMNYPKEDDMHAIVKSQLMPVFNTFQNDAKSARKLTINESVKALISVHSSISERFTSSQQSHYVFTPKMLTQCIFGLLNYPKDDFQKACISELNNTFCNRLVNDTSIQHFNEIIKTQFQSSPEIDGQNVYFVPSGPRSSSFVCMAEEEWNEIVTRNVAVCCSDDVFMEIPITKEILRLTSHICCVLSQPGKNLLLCGMNGSGRKESMHIACSFLQIKIFSPVPVKNYKIEDFYNDLRTVMQTSALDDQVTVFHIDHAELSYLPDIMKPIEAILEGSDIPELFGDEIETVASPLRNAAQLDGYQESIASYFWKRVKNNVHLVITLETSTKGLNDIFGQYASLYRNTEMVYLRKPQSQELLPKTILQSLSSQQRVEVPLPSSFPTIGFWQLSPLRYSQLIKTYGHTYIYYFKTMREEKLKLQAGVDKLSSAHSVVETLKAEAQEQEIALAEKRKLANQALEMISSTMRNATDQRTDLLELKQQTQESSQKLMERKKAIEIELRDVEPVLKEASAAVGQIKGEALSEIRSLRAPPEVIRDILEGVLRLMGIRDTSWNSMKSFLAKRGVKEDIRSLDPARISSENCSAVEKLLLSKADSFEQKNAKRASVAAAPLAAWVIANVKYSKVVQSIKPLEREQNMLKKNLEEAEGQIKSLTSGLDDVDARVKELSGQLNMYTQEAAVLEIKLNEARNTLRAAEVLVQKLSSEYSSWNNQLDALNNELENLVNKAYLIALNITHLSHYTYENRMVFMTKIMDELHIKEFSVMQNIITDQDKIMWESMGLTADVQSMENAALLSQMLKLPFNSAPIPLLTDPTGSANSWLSKYLNSQSIPHEICNQNNDRFTYTLELAVRFGKCLIIQDVQLTKPPLLSILYGELKCRFNKKYLQVASKMVDFHEDFKLILVSRLSKVDVGMEIGAYVTNIPFTTTVAGYTDQLMAKSIQLKQPELEEKRLHLLQNEGQLGKQKLELQDKLLVELSSAQGDILKNELLLKTLNEVKESSALIDTSLEESGQIRRKLMLEYDQYKTVCENAAKFFNGINKIYKITVTVFTNLFLKSISHQEKFDTETSYAHLIKLCYSMLSRAIPTSDQLMLGLHICKYAYPQKLPDKEWELFITNFMSSEDISHAIPSWIKKELHSKISCLIMNYPEFYETLQFDNEIPWTKYADDSNEMSIPSSNITEFQKVLVTQIFHPNQLTNIISTSVAKLLQINNVFAAKPTIQQLAIESHHENPILLVTSGGMDPAKEIEEFVTQKYGKNRFIEISIGKGQESSSLVLLRKAASEGLCLCIKNVHLVPHWLDVLSQELNVLEPSKDFRLYLVCETLSNFPESLLLKCNQIRYEPPSGVKNKLLRLIQQWGPLVTQKRDPKTMKLYIIMFILNSVLQERRSYIPQGWTKWYDFSESDLRTAVSIISWMEKSTNYKVDWSVIRGLCQHIAYGGRIDNHQDLQLLLTLLQQFFGEHVLSSNWSPLQFKILIPQSSNILDYTHAISKLADVELPDIFGLPTSTNTSKDLLFCRNLLKRLKSNYYSTTDSENYDKRLKPFLSMWKKLSSGSSVIQSYKAIPNESPKTPWNSFILSEMRLAGRLFETIHNTLVHLHVIVKDNASLPMEDVQLLESICENLVPLKWRQIWAGSRTLTEYMKSVVSRSIEAERRFKTMMHLDFGDEIDFVNVFNIESYLAALKLTNAKELGQSTCHIDIKSTLLGRIEKSNLTSPKVGSIMIDGATLRNNKVVMIDQLTLSQSSSYPNIITDFQINYNLDTEVLEKDVIELPLYSNSTREHLICTLKMRTDAPKEVITLAGIALIVPEN